MSSLRTLCARIMRWPVSPVVISWVGRMTRSAPTGSDGAPGSEPAPLRILVVRLDAIGDLVLTSAFLRELRGYYPDAEITLVVSRTVVELVENCPYVDRIMHVEIRNRGWASWYGLTRDYRRFARKHFGATAPNLALLPRLDVDRARAGYLAYFSGAPRIVGFSETALPWRAATDKGLNTLLTDVLVPAGAQHDVLSALQLIEALGGTVRDDGIEVWLSSEDREQAQNLLSSAGASGGQGVIAVAPGAGHPRRMWPVEFYRETVQRILETWPGFVAIVGGAGEEAIAEELKRRNPGRVINATARLTLRGAAALLEQCTLFVGNDSGPMHLAAACGVRVVEISCHAVSAGAMHTQSPTRFAPWGVSHSILQPLNSRSGCATGCRSETAHCICDISVDMVENAIKAHLDALTSS